jgi:CspA family cold shock protein
VDGHASAEFAQKDGRTEQRSHLNRQPGERSTSPLPSAWKSKEEADMKKGTVKFFNQTKGYGYIKEEGSNIEIFVHVSGLKDEIKENDIVFFEIQQGKKGANAVNVRLTT